MITVFGFEWHSFAVPGGEPQRKFQERCPGGFDFHAFGHRERQKCGDRGECRRSEEGRRQRAELGRRGFRRRRSQIQTQRVAQSRTGASDPGEAGSDQQQDRRADHKYDPTFEVVQHTFRHLDAPVLDRDTDQSDAQTVHQDRHRNARQEQNAPLPQRRSEQVRNDESESHQREQVPQAAAGLDHLQLETSQIDDVAVEEDTDSEQPDDRDADGRGEQLQPQRERIREEGGQWDHEQEDEQRHPQPPEHPGSDKGQRQPVKHEQKRVLPDDVNRAQLGHAPHQDAGQQNGNAPPGSLERGPHQRIPLTPDEEQRDDRDQDAVAVLGLQVPDIEQPAQNVVERNECDDESEPEYSPPQ